MKVRIGYGESVLWLARGIEHGELPYQFEVSGTRLVQEAPLFRATHTTYTDRGNLATELRFTVDREHNSLEEAVRFCLLHKEQFAGLSGTVILTSEDGGSESNLFFTGARVRNVRTHQMGRESVTTYNIVGAAISDTDPGA